MASVEVSTSWLKQQMGISRMPEFILEIYPSSGQPF